MAPVPVGSKGVKIFQGKEVSASAAGFYDLSGNVYEWTQSEFCPYATVMDEGLSCGSGRAVLRGGSAFDINIRSQTPGSPLITLPYRRTRCGAARKPGGTYAAHPKSRSPS